MAAELTLTVRAVRRRYLFLSAVRWFATGLTFPVQMLLYAANGLDLELPTGGLADLLGSAYGSASGRRWPPAPP